MVNELRLLVNGIGAQYFQEQAPGLHFVQGFLDPVIILMPL
jgi:hypothetical protein